MSKTIDTSSQTITTTERTACIEEQTPVNGRYRILVHRELVKTLPDGTVLSRQSFPEAVNELVEDTLKRKCTADYLTACQAAKAPIDLVAAKAAWADAIVDEVRAERAQTAAAEAAQANG